jgi:hypothetical protein
MLCKYEGAHPGRKNVHTREVLHNAFSATVSISEETVLKIVLLTLIRNRVTSYLTLHVRFK